jgi:histidinol-phosphate/aromatic aminotransferase/cobyric acid decarboxylase-like protein
VARENLPPDTILLIDEAYIHFGESTDLETALPYVRQGKNVVVARTFSKIYGMAGVRAGFVCARAGVDRAHAAVPQQRALGHRHARGAGRADGIAHADSRAPRHQRGVRRETCAWLRERKLPYIDTQANFMMIDVGLVIDCNHANVPNNLMVAAALLMPALAQKNTATLSPDGWDFNITTPSGTRACWLGVTDKGGKLEVWYQPTGGNVYKVKTSTWTGRT